MGVCETFCVENWAITPRINVLCSIWNWFERPSRDSISRSPAEPHCHPGSLFSEEMGAFWCPLPDSFENYLASIMMDTLCLKWWMGSNWKRMTWNLKNDMSVGGQTFFFRIKVDISLKYSMEDCSIIFLSQKKSVAVLYPYARWGRKPILKLKWILPPPLRSTWEGLRSEFIHSPIPGFIERLLHGG